MIFDISTKLSMYNWNLIGQNLLFKAQTEYNLVLERRILNKTIFEFEIGNNYIDNLINLTKLDLLI